MKREEYKRDLWQEYVENADYIERVWKEGVIDLVRRKCSWKRETFL